MNKELIWGVPTQRTKRVEKFSNPVVTMSAIEEKGSGRKFSFNAAAQEVLGLEGGETYVIFGFEGERILVLASASENPNGFQLTKQCSFSNKKLYDYITKVKNLNTNTENHLHLVPVEGEMYYEVSAISSEITVELEEKSEVEELKTIATEKDLSEDVPQTPGPVFAVDNEEDSSDEWA